MGWNAAGRRVTWEEKRNEMKRMEKKCNKVRGEEVKGCVNGEELIKG